MGLIDDIASFFTGDIFYPDNPKRAARLKELECDCNRLFQDCKKLAQQIDQQFATLRGLLSPQDWVDDFPSFLSPSLESDTGQRAYQLSCTLLSPTPAAGKLSSLLMTPIVQDGHSWVFGLPDEFFTFGLQRGMESRARLREGIRSVGQARRQIAYLRNFNMEFLNVVKGAVLALKAVADAHIPVDTSAALHKLSTRAWDMREWGEREATRVDAWLATLDQARGAWTAEG